MSPVRASIFVALVSAGASILFYLLRLSQFNEQDREYVVFFWIAVLAMPVGALIALLMAAIRK